MDESNYRDNRGKHRPLVALAGFTKTGPALPSLLTMDEVKLFHEFRHALHGLLTNSEY